MRTEYQMIVDTGSGLNPVAEPVPDELSRKGAPDITKLPPVGRARKTVQWFNDTRRAGEKERKLIRVEMVTYEVIMDAELEGFIERANDLTARIDAEINR